MIENRRRHGANAFRHPGIYEYAKFPGIADTALHLAPLAFRKMVQELGDSLPVRVERQKQVPLGGVERQHGSQPDVELHQFRLRFTHPDNHGAIAGSQAEHRCLLHFLRQLREVSFRKLHDLHAAHSGGAKLDQQSAQSVQAVSLGAQQSCPRE
jgi:hypothetical protein